MGIWSRYSPRPRTLRLELHFVLNTVFKPIFQIMSRHQIHCINKSDRTSRWESISNIGGVNNNGTRWKMSQTEAIKDIGLGTYEFFVKAGSAETNVIVATSSQGNKYLKTEADSTTKDNLLSLPECP